MRGSPPDSLPRASVKAAGTAFRPLGLLHDVGEDFQFLFFGCGGEAGNAGKKFGGGFLHVLQAILIDGQRFAEEGFQGAIDEVDDAGFARPRGLIRRDNAGGEGFDFARLVGGEDFERGIAGLGRLVGVFGGGKTMPVSTTPALVANSKKLRLPNVPLAIGAKW